MLTKGERIDLFGLTWVVVKITKRHVQIARPVSDAFGKPMLIGHKTWHKSDLANMCNCEGGR